MVFRKKISLAILLLTFFACQQNNTNKPPSVIKNNKQTQNFDNTLFKLVDSKSSNLIFNNEINHDLTTSSNLFDFDYFYNGAGVGLGDINNDGLLDVFFCGNQVPNKLFLNKGNLQFEDITTTANINVKKNWSNGVSFADVNNDGFLDIYISQGGPYKDNYRKNLLYINQKNNTFKEEAELFGLADSAISTQSAFFDFDKDGDLDCFVMNESEHYGYDPMQFHIINKDKEVLSYNSSHLYENRNGKFVDITEKSGLLNATFGLGLCITDLNKDGWLDIYIANDYYIPDALYISNKNGTFTNKIKEATKQVSFFGMGIDIADINNDNLDDIYVLDMASKDHVRSKTLMASMNTKQFDLLKNLGYQNQYMFNSLQLNIGNNKFHNLSQMTGLSKTDWSWSALISDFDFDQNEDIYVTNGYRRYALNNDMRLKVRNAKRNYRNKVPLKIKEKLYNELPSEKLPNVYFKNNGNLKFENATSESGLDIESFSNGCAYGDLDNDGDLDVIVNNMDNECFLFKNFTVENKAGNFLKIIPTGILSESFVKVECIFNGHKKTKESKRVRGYLSSIDSNIYFGLGSSTKVDTLKIYWASGKYQELNNIKANSTISIKEKNATKHKTYFNKKNKQIFSENKNLITFKHEENIFNDFEKEVLLPYKQSTLGPFITKGDVNGDQKQDFYIGGAHNQAGTLFIKTANGYRKIKTLDFERDSYYEDMESIFIDIDNDGDEDLYVVSGGNEFKDKINNYEDRIYLNDGKGNFKRHKKAGLEKFKLNGKTITKIDFDKDGDQDIIVGNRVIPQNYPLYQTSLVLENKNGRFTDVTNEICPILKDFGIVNKIIKTDLNNDGWEDFIAVGEWTHIGIFKNVNGKFIDISSKSNLNNLIGWWQTIIEIDVNNDNKRDYIIGNIGSNLKFKVDDINPLRVYADDFDNSGTLDIILSQQYNGLFVPSRGKECSTMQMPFLKNKIPSYNQFANSSLLDIYGDKINNCYRKEANEFKSIVLINKGNDLFEKQYLPRLAQTIPLLTCDLIDLNNDNYIDVIIGGNIYNTEVETPRLDNNYALALISDKKNNFNVITPNKTGLYTNGNVKCIKVLDPKNGPLLVGRNNNYLQIFELNM